jgi:uncharacterized protein (TIGR02646 family)
MRTIRKSTRPASLERHRATPEADYDGYRDKDTLRACLVREQRGLCCYCLSPIRPEWDAMKIEHWHSQANHPAEQLDYTNILGACVGNQRASGKFQHCDTRKGDRDISRNPANPDHRIEDLIRFLGDGQIVSTDPAFETEINEVLNLNLQSLMNKRKGVLDGFTKLLAKNGGTVLPRMLEKHLQRWNGELDNRDLRPFCQVVIYYLRKKLAQPRAR